MDKNEIIKIIKKSDDKNTFLREISRFLSDCILEEIKDKRIIISEGTKNGIKATEIAYEVSLNEESMYSLSESEAYKCLDDSEILSLVNSKFGINNEEIVSKIREDLFGKLSGDIYAIYFNTDNNAGWLESLEELIDNEKITSINGVSREKINKIMEVCNLLGYSTSETNAVFNDYFDIQNRGLYATIIAEVDDKGEYIRHDNGYAKLHLFPSDVINNKMVLPFKISDDDKKLYNLLRKLNYNEEMASLMTMKYSREDQAFNKFMREFMILSSESVRFIEEHKISVSKDSNAPQFSNNYIKKEYLIKDYPHLYNNVKDSTNKKDKEFDENVELLNTVAEKAGDCYSYLEIFSKIGEGKAIDGLLKATSKGLKEYGSRTKEFYDSIEGELSLCDGWIESVYRYGKISNGLTAATAIITMIDYFVEIYNGDLDEAYKTVKDSGVGVLLGYVAGKTLTPLIVDVCVGLAISSGPGFALFVAFGLLVGSGVLVDAYKELIGIGIDWLSKKFEKALESGKYDAILAHWLRDPLILDLNGAGFVTTMNKDGVHFDLNCDGFAERINWTTENGLLALDLNGNGMIDDGGEVFGDSTLLPDGSRAKNGFEALAQYDLNKDGIIDENDEIYERLKVWVDADASGESEEGELKSLKELGIKAINLNYEAVNEKTDTEVVIGNRATYVKEDGSEMAIGEMIKMETALSLVAMETIRFWQDWVLISSMVEKVVTY